MSEAVVNMGILFAGPPVVVTLDEAGGGTASGELGEGLLAATGGALCVPISRARSSRGSDGVRCRGDGAVAIATGNGDRLDGLGSGDGDGPAVQGRGRS